MSVTNVVDSKGLVSGPAVRTAKLYPAADSTTALRVMKADGTTPVMTFNTTSALVGIGLTPLYHLHLAVTPASGSWLSQFENTGANSHGLYVKCGASTSSYVAFQVDSNSGGTTAICALADGKVGIGTAAPVSKLSICDVNKTVLTLYSDNNVLIATTNDMAIDKGGVLSLGGIATTGSTTPIGLAHIKGAKENSTNSDSSGYMAFLTTKSGVGAVERMRITSGGKVGIGTVEPAGKLHICDTSASNHLGLIVENLDTNGWGSTIQFRANYGYNVPVAEVVGVPTTGNGGYLTLRTKAAAGVMTDRLTIDHNGNVGIRAAAQSAISLRVMGTGTSGATVSLVCADGNNNPLFCVYDNNTINLSATPAVTATNAMYMDGSGNIGKSSSSMRFKDNIRVMGEDYAKILKIDTKIFTMRNDGASDFGGLAEDFVEAGLSALVNFDADKAPDNIKDHKIVWYLIEVAKIQQARIDALEARVGGS